MSKKKTQEEKEREMEKMLENEMKWKDEYRTEMCICMELNDNTLLETWKKQLHTEKMTIPLVPKNVMESMEVGKEINIPKREIDKVSNFYLDFIDKSKITSDEWFDMVVFGVLPKQI